MKINTILTACNLEPLYLDFIPSFITVWKHLFPHVNVKIILVANEIPKNLMIYKKYIEIFTPIANIPTSFIAQVIRILYPGLLTCDDGVLITDMDMIPVTRDYYVKYIEEYSDDKFITYRDDAWCFNNNQYAMCYNVATPEVWRTIFPESVSIDSICKKLLEYWEVAKKTPAEGKEYLWYFDQIHLFRKVNEHRDRLIILGDQKTKYKRLDRVSYDINDTNKNIAALSTFTDFHMLRPYRSHQYINDTYVNAILET